MPTVADAERALAARQTRPATGVKRTVGQAEAQLKATAPLRQPIPATASPVNTGPTITNTPPGLPTQVGTGFGPNVVAPPPIDVPEKRVSLLPEVGAPGGVPENAAPMLERDRPADERLGEVVPEIPAREETFQRLQQRQAIRQPLPKPPTDVELSKKVATAEFPKGKFGQYVAGIQRNPLGYAATKGLAAALRMTGAHDSADILDNQAETAEYLDQPGILNKVAGAIGQMGPDIALMGQLDDPSLAGYGNSIRLGFLGAKLGAVHQISNALSGHPIDPTDVLNNAAIFSVAGSLPKYGGARAIAVNPMLQAAAFDVAGIAAKGKVPTQDELKSYLAQYPADVLAFGFLDAVQRAPEAAKKALTAKIEGIIPLDQVGQLYQRVKAGNASPEDQALWAQIKAVVTEAASKGIKASELGIRVTGTGPRRGTPEWLANTLGIKTKVEPTGIAGRPAYEEAEPIAGQKKQLPPYTGERNVTPPPEPSPYASPSGTPTPSPEGTVAPAPIPEEEEELTKEQVKAAPGGEKPVSDVSAPVPEAKGTPAPAVEGKAEGLEAVQKPVTPPGVTFDGIEGEHTGKPLWQFTVRDPNDIDNGVTFYTPVGTSPEGIVAKLNAKRAEFAAGRTPEAQAALGKFGKQPEPEAKPAVLPPSGGRSKLFEQAAQEQQISQPVVDLTKPHLTAAAVQHEGKVWQGPNHPAIDKHLGKPETTKEQRNNSTYGFIVDDGKGGKKFVDRATATEIAKASGQALEDYETGHQLHSDEAVTEFGTPISETKQEVKPAVVPPEASKEGEVTTRNPVDEWLKRLLRKAQLDAEGESRLVELDDRNANPQAIVNEFFDNTYPNLPPEAKAKVDKWLPNYSGGFKPGDTIGTQNGPGGTRIPLVARSWKDVFTDLGNKVEHLEGTDRGLVVMLDWANERFKQKPITIIPPAALPSAAAPKEPETPAEKPPTPTKATTETGAASKRAKILADYEIASDKAIAENLKAITVEKDEDDPERPFWYVSGKGKSSATINQTDKGFEVFFDDGLGHSDSTPSARGNTLEGAIQEAKDKIQYADNELSPEVNPESVKGELIETLDLPPNVKMKDVRDTANGSVYYQFEVSDGTDEEGEPINPKEYKVRIATHEPSPFREKEFGESQGHFYVPEKNASAKDWADAVGRVETWIAKRAAEKSAPASAEPAVHKAEPPKPLTPAEALHQGQKVKLPKEANAVTVIREDSKSSRVLKTNLDTLKGAGPFKTVKPTKVPFDSKGRPKWDEVKVVKGKIEVGEPKKEIHEPAIADAKAEGDEPQVKRQEQRPPTEEERDLVGRMANHPLRSGLLFEATGPPVETLEIVRANDFAAAFGKRIVWYRQPRGTRREGTSDARLPNIIFLNTESAVPFVEVATHELLHDMSFDNKPLYQELSDFVALHSKHAKTYTAQLEAQGYPKEQFVAEATADFVREALRDPTRMAEAMGKEPGLFARFMRWIRDWIDKLKKRFTETDTSPRGVAGITDSLDEIRAKVVDVLKRYRESAQDSEPEPGQIGDMLAEEPEEKKPPLDLRYVRDKQTGEIKARVKEGTKTLHETKPFKTVEEAEAEGQKWIDAQKPPEPPSIEGEPAFDEEPEESVSAQLTSDKRGPIREALDVFEQKTFPALHNASPEAGQHAARMIAVREAAPLRARIFADAIRATGVDEASFGAAVVEGQLRGIKNGFLEDAKWLDEEGKTDEAGAMRENADEVSTVIGQENSPFQEEEDYQAFLQTPEAQKAFDVWKERWNKEVEPIYKTLQDIEPDEELPGRDPSTGIRSNLLAASHDKGPNLRTVSAKRGSVTNVFRRKSPFVRKAYGNAEEYVTALEPMLENTFGRQMEQYEKRKMEDALVKSGNAKIGRPGQQLTIKGEPTVGFPLTRMMILRTKGEQTKAQPASRTLYVPQSLATEIRSAENLDARADYPRLEKFGQLFNKLALAGWTEGMWHSVNLVVGSVSTPSATGILPLDTILKLAGRSDVWAVILPRAIRNVLTANAEKLLPIVEIAAGRSGYGGRLIGKGLTHIDNGVRLTYGQIYDELAKKGIVEGTEAEKREFITSAAGQYNPRMRGKIYRALKEAGISPFITAGQTQANLAYRNLFLDPRVKGRTPTQKALLHINMLANIIGVFVFAGVLSWLFTRKPNPPDVPAGAVYWGKRDARGRPIYWDVARWFGIRRMQSATGMGSIVRGVAQKLPPGMIADQALQDIVNAQISPLAGPVVQFASKAMTGKAPRLGAFQEYPKAPQGETNKGRWIGRAAIEANPATRLAKDIVTGRPYDQILQQQFQPFETLAGKKYETPAENLAARFWSDTPGATTQDERDKSQLKRQLVDMIRIGNPDGQSELLAAVQAHKLTERDANAIRKEGQMTLLESRLRHLSAEDAVQVFQIATPEEAAKVRGMVEAKIYRSQHLSWDEKQKLREKMQSGGHVQDLIESRAP